jgi:3-phosphoshikimate 1-carboxyvinyltransferase
MTSAISHPVSHVHGFARVPGDKSISHRAIMLGGLAEDETIISGLLEGDDVLHTAHAMRALGAKIYKDDDGLWRCEGIGSKNLQTPSHTLDMGNSGTSARLLMGILAGHDIRCHMIGDASLSKRPMMRVITPLTQMGATFNYSEGGRLPLMVTGSVQLQAIDYVLPVASAQVKSAILLAGLRAQGTTRVTENIPTRDHTENMFTAFGINIDVENNTITMKGGQIPQGCAVDVPADPSSAAFPLVAAVIQKNAELTLNRVGINPRRSGLFDTLREMGADITFKSSHMNGGEKVADIIVRGGVDLHGVDVAVERIASMIDEIPILCVAASFATGTTRIHNLAELRVKESDRLLMMAQGLKSCGVNLDMGEDWIHIHGTGQRPSGGATISTALDHRIAMSFLVMGSACDEAVTVDDITPIRTSFPNFISLMNDIGLNIT